MALQLLLQQQDIQSWYRISLSGEPRPTSQRKTLIFTMVSGVLGDKYLEN